MPHSLSKNSVDAHFHVFDAGVAQGKARYVPAYDAPMPAWRSLAEPHGIRRGVLVQPSFLGTDNTRLMKELRGDPDGLRGVAVVSLDVDMQELLAMDAAGVRGIRLNLSGAPGGARIWAGAHRLWDMLFALRWHVELHTDIGALPAVIDLLPEGMPLVVDHMGKPDCVSASDPTVRLLAQRAMRSPVHMKLSGAYRLAERGGHGVRNAGELARLWLDELGAAALVWGSDWPHTNHEADVQYASLVRDLYDWVGEDAAVAALADNPARLYWRQTDA